MFFLTQVKFLGHNARPATRSGYVESGFLSLSGLVALLRNTGYGMGVNTDSTCMIIQWNLR